MSFEPDIMVYKDEDAVASLQHTHAEAKKEPAFFAEFGQPEMIPGEVSGPNFQLLLAMPTMLD